MNYWWFYINKSFSFICIIDKVTKRILCIQLNVWENRTVRVCALEKRNFCSGSLRPFHRSICRGSITCIFEGCSTMEGTVTGDAWFGVRLVLHPSCVLLSLCHLLAALDHDLLALLVRLRGCGGVLCHGGLQGVSRVTNERLEIKENY